MPRQLIIALCLLTCVAGCGKHRLWKKKEKPPLPASAPMTSNYTAQDLAGTWNLQMPGGQRGTVTITPINANNLSLSGGGNFAGNYVVQGPHLLILTTDKRLYLLAWQIMNKDSLLLTRAPSPADVGADYTGATLTRAAATTAR